VLTGIHDPPAEVCKGKLAGLETTSEHPLPNPMDMDGHAWLTFTPLNLTLNSDFICLVRVQLTAILYMQPEDCGFHQWGVTDTQ